MYERKINGISSDIDGFIYIYKWTCINGIPSGYLTYPWHRCPIEIDGLPNLKMVDLSMANR